MLDLHPKYTVDDRGNRLVVLTEQEYEHLLALAELNEPDPDAGLELRSAFKSEMNELDARIKQGKTKMKSLDQVARELGIYE